VPAVLEVPVPTPVQPRHGPQALLWLQPASHSQQMADSKAALHKGGLEAAVIMLRNHLLDVLQGSLHIKDGAVRFMIIAF